MTTIQELERNNGLLRQWCNARDDRIRDMEKRVEKYEKLLTIAANRAHDSGEEESFEDAINAALR